MSNPVICPGCFQSNVARRSLCHKCNRDLALPATINDYARCLGLGSAWSEEQVNEAYRQLARKYHPNTNFRKLEAAALLNFVEAAREALTTQIRMKAAEPAPQPPPTRNSNASADQKPEQPPTRNSPSSVERKRKPFPKWDNYKSAGQTRKPLPKWDNNRSSDKGRHAEQVPPVQGTGKTADSIDNRELYEKLQNVIRQSRAKEAPEPLPTTLFGKLLNWFYNALTPKP